MRAFFALFRLRALDVTRSPSSLTLFFALPLILLSVVAFVFANGHPFERREVVVVAMPGDSFAADVAVHLDMEPELRVLRVEDEAFAHARLRTRTSSAIVIPSASGLSASGLLTQNHIKLITAPRERLFAQGLASSLTRLLLPTSSSSVEIEVEAIPRWGYVHYLFPGLLTFSVILAGLFGMGYAMVRYRSTLFLKKLATTPLSRATFVAAQVAARTALVLVQVVLMVIVGRVAFDIPLSAASAAWLVVVTILGLLTFSGVGFALASIIKSETLMVDLINALTVPLVFFSEIFFPLSELPSWLRSICGVLPSTGMVRLTRDVLLFGVTDLARLAPGLAGLAAWTIITYAVAIFLFRWHK